MQARIVIDAVRPSTPDGNAPAKAAAGEHVPVSADIFKDGHDIIAARVRWSTDVAPANRAWRTSSLQLVLNDNWEGEMRATEIGMHVFTVEAWTDVYATWRHKLEVKLEARQDVGVELAEGTAFFERRASEATDSASKSTLSAVASDLKVGNVERALTDATVALVSEPGETDYVTSSREMRLWVDRERALAAAWYELFPRSFGGLKGATEQLDYVASMKFDVVYIPPVHPIGNSFRKGRNNTLDPKPEDVGSPWAIGNATGGHMALHEDLGTIDDFDRFVARANELGMEIALDYALQCSPDHPWVKQHPEWFHHRPDGSIAYAENPPKKYQDIYPINFWPEQETDRVALWTECKKIVDYWIGHGIKIFRVDNPHTKPIAFWAWMLPEVQKENPDVIFLSEAFTRPKVMAKLAEVGFSQSYTYFTWRRAKWELIEYGVEVATGRSSDYMRPNFWPNTPDILAHPLRYAPLSAFRMRFALAATMVPSYGIYSGFELGENEPQSESNEEYLSAEKYELKHRDYNATYSLSPWILAINEARRKHPALRQLRNIWFHGADNDALICYSKRSGDGSDTVLVVINLDPHHAQETTLSLNMEQLGLAANDAFHVTDELTQRTFHWQGPHNYVRLTPDEPAHIFHVRTVK